MVPQLCVYDITITQKNNMNLHTLHNIGCASTYEVTKHNHNILNVFVFTIFSHDNLFFP